MASIRHELRTPITVITSSSANLAQRIISEKEKVKKYGRIIQEQSQRLIRMVEGIPTYSGLGSGNRLEPTTVDTAEFIGDIVRSLQDTARGEGARII